MTEQRYSRGAIRASNAIILAEQAGDGPLLDHELAAIISEETGDLALIEALEGLLEIAETVTADLHEQIKTCPYEELCGDDLCDSVGCVIDKMNAARAALAAARKEG